MCKCLTELMSIIINITLISLLLRPHTSLLVFKVGSFTPSVSFEKKKFHAFSDKLHDGP